MANQQMYELAIRTPGYLHIVNVFNKNCCKYKEEKIYNYSVTFFIMLPYHTKPSV
jgi:hypothetical protein